MVIVVLHQGSGNSWTFMDPQMYPSIEIKGRMVQNTLNPFIQKGPTDPQTGGLFIQMEI